PGGPSPTWFGAGGGRSTPTSARAYIRGLPRGDHRIRVPRVGHPSGKSPPSERGPAETERANGRGRSRGRSPHHRTRCGRTTGVHPGPTYEDAGAHGFRRLCDSRDGVAPRGTFDELTTMAGSSMNNGDQQGAVGTLNPTYTPDISQGPATCGGPDGGSLFPLTSCPGPRRPGWRPRR